MNVNRWTRKLHRWGSLAIAVPLLLVIGTGLLLLVKKNLDWVQPPAQRGVEREPRLPFARILAVAKTVPEAAIRGWEDIDRLDVRPSKGLVKVRAKNRWEVQIDTATADILQVAYRRSDLIESLHDGTWFDDRAKLWVLLPSALVLLFLWGSGLYLFVLPHWRKRQARRKRRAAAAPPMSPAQPAA